MYIKNLTIGGYRLFNQEFGVELNQDLTVLIGENGTGKSALVDAIRLLLLEDEYGRNGVSPRDFHRPISKTVKHTGAESMQISCEFADLEETEQIAYLPWLDAHDPTRAKLTLEYENAEDQRGRYKRRIWGGCINKWHL